jgi:alpha-L-fucosidase
MKLIDFIFVQNQNRPYMSRTLLIKNLMRVLVSLSLLVWAPVFVLAQIEYPPETKAIPIPEMEDLPLADGPFKGTPESLKQFQCPDWFRDAKFGIWAHWGPQAVPGDGDWYARQMYLDEKRGSHDAYQSHLKLYGHPSKAGYKDILPLWTAAKWDPDRLMELYKAAGAHYFVAQAVHHDNFDNWNSKYQKWNSVNIGPHKDMVGTWQMAAKKLGLPFGVSEHLGHSFTFMQSSHGSDKSGPLAGVPYDGANPLYWDLYQLPADPDDTGWYSKDPRWAQEWYARIYDLVTTYKPDLLYSDGGLPFGQAGRNIVAQLYNLSIETHDGKQEAVYCCKKSYHGTDFIDGSCVQDLERGMMTDIQPLPWQTDTSTGEWFWVPNDRYRSSDEVIHSLADIVSKNGNLLLNVTLLPDGSLAPQMETFLHEMADWTKINGDAIFGTRPWTIFGEGPTDFKSGAFHENFKFTAQDIRFTRKGDAIYAITLGVPKEQLLIRALAQGSPLVAGEINSITLLGSAEKIQWSRNADGVVVSLPGTLPCKSSLCFKISGLTTVAGLTPPVAQAFQEQIKKF